MNFDSLTETMRREQERQRLIQMLRDQQSAQAAAAQRRYGDAFAGINERGQIVLWRRSTVPRVPRKAHIMDIEPVKNEPDAEADKKRELIMVTQRINDMAAGGILAPMIRAGLHAEKWHRDVVADAMARRFERQE